MIEEQKERIAQLTGVKSSKQSYYTQLKETVQQMKKKNMQLEIINDMMKSFKVDRSIDDMLKNILHKLQEIIFIDYLLLFLYDNQHLTLTNSYPESLSLKIANPVKQSLIWQAIKNKKVLINSFSTINEATDFERDIYQNIETSTFVTLPLFNNETIIGALCLGSKQETKYEESDIDFLQQLADQLTVCIENTRLYHIVLQRKKEWEETFRAVDDMLIVVDLTGSILRFNESAESFLNIKENQPCSIIFTNIDHENQNPLTETYQTRKTAYRQLHFHDDRICDVYSYPVFNEENTMYGAILYIKDVTDKLQMEAQLMHSGKLAALGEMAAGVAHELNSPLTAILGNSQILMREFHKDNSSYNLLHDIKQCGIRCKKIIQNLLTFSRQEELRVEKCSINQAVEQVLSLVGYQIRRNEIDLSIQLTEELPFFQGNLQQIEQIVINLLLNAKDSLEMSKKTNKKIIIKTTFQKRNDYKWLVLSVKDNGIGIVDKHLSEIFHPFFTTKEAMKGTGLGLSVSLGIAKAHGGTIEVKSTYQRGSIFSLLLPLDHETDSINQY
ncbi:sensor histidine kinase [Bacillus taeanensis]|uniref:histidine kinase n=1 Tax=Bacillus taeanensis TaxID=273032 RepID=A0A366XUN1_9BACI|nr:ATP-binding protein [Bacillus taeanensis]RBW68479.1 histidine kinase [Bacillus taeanensis]